MAKREKKDKISVEDRFIKVLKENNIEFQNKLFNIGDALYLPDLVFGHLIVEVEDNISENHIKIIKKFKKHFPGYRVILLAGEDAHYMEAAKEFDEVFNFKSVNLLISEIKENLGKGNR